MRRVTPGLRLVDGWVVVAVQGRWALIAKGVCGVQGLVHRTVRVSELRPTLGPLFEAVA